MSVANRSRRVPLDLSTSIYNPLEAHGLDRDIGVADMIRYILAEWVRENPCSNSVAVNP